MNYHFKTYFLMLAYYNQWANNKLFVVLEAFHQALTYIRRNQTYTEPLIEVLAHMFNHQTHHRGQMHNMVFKLTGISLELDLIYFQRENACLYH